MGSVPSTVYNFCRRKILRYNVQNRALKFLEKERISPAPRHPIPSTYESKVKPQDSPSLKHIHEKSQELTGHLKKVYLTSTSQITGTPSKRPLPKKENERPKPFMFYEPETPAPGHVTLTNVVKILNKAQDENAFSTPSVIAREFNLDKKDASNLIAYYSLFRLENFDFMNAVKNNESTEEAKKLESSEFKQAQKHITAK